MGVAVFSAMSHPVECQRTGSEADQLSRLLEIELIQKRAVWEQAKQRKKSLRSLAFLVLFLLVAASLFGLFFAFNRVSEERQKRPVAASDH